MTRWEIVVKKRKANRKISLTSFKCWASFRRTVSCRHVKRRCISAGLQDDRMCSKWGGSFQSPHLASSRIPLRMRFFGIFNRLYVERMMNRNHMGSNFHKFFLGAALSPFIQTHWDSIPTALVILFPSSTFRNSSFTVFLLSLQSEVSHLWCTPTSEKPRPWRPMHTLPTISMF